MDGPGKILTKGLQQRATRTFCHKCCALPKGSVGMHETAGHLPIGYHAGYSRYYRTCRGFSENAEHFPCSFLGSSHVQITALKKETYVMERSFLIARWQSKLFCFSHSPKHHSKFSTHMQFFLEPDAESNYCLWEPKSPMLSMILLSMVQVMMLNSLLMVILWL